HRDLHSFPTRRSSDLSGRSVGQYGSAAETWVTIGPSAKVPIRPQVRSTNWSQITNSPGRTLGCRLPAAHGPNTHSTPRECSAQRSEEHTSELQSPCNL